MTKPILSVAYYSPKLLLRVLLGMVVGIDSKHPKGINQYNTLDHD